MANTLVDQYQKNSWLFTTYSTLSYTLVLTSHLISPADFRWLLLLPHSVWFWLNRVIFSISWSNHLCPAPVKVDLCTLEPISSTWKNKTILISSGLKDLGDDLIKFEEKTLWPAVRLRRYMYLKDGPDLGRWNSHTSLDDWIRTLTNGSFYPRP